MELRNIILSEVSQVQKAKSRMFSVVCGITDQIQTHQYYEKQVTYEITYEITYERGSVKEGS
jgi:hypothetical protein